MLGYRHAERLPEHRGAAQPILKSSTIARHRARSRLLLFVSSLDSLSPLKKGRSAARRGV